MGKRFFLILIFLLLSYQAHSSIQIISLPTVSQATQKNLNIIIGKLKLYLPTYNWIFCDKKNLYNVIAAASQILHNATNELKLSQGNYVSGQNNIVFGTSNIVIGSQDTIIGIGNWCFTSDYSTPKDKIDEGILAISKYKIQMGSISRILDDPTQVISTLDPDQLLKLRTKNSKMSFFFKS